MLEYLQGFLSNILNSAMSYGPRIISGIVILIVGWLVARWAASVSTKFFIKSEAIDKTLERYITRLLRFFVLAIAVVAALASFGVQTTSLIAVLGAMGLAVGLALQGTLANVASGLVLLFLRPFHVDDWVEANGVTGQIREVGLFATELKTGDGLFVLVPNAKIWGGNITNFVRNGTRRVELVFSIGYGDDMDRAVSIIEEIIGADDRVLEDPAPFIKVAELADSSVNIYARPWATVSDFFGLKLDLTKRVKERFDEEGISIPFPQQEIHVVRETEAA